MANKLNKKKKQCIEGTLDIIRLLIKSDKADREKLLNSLSAKHINNICEFFFNIINNPHSKNLDTKVRRRIRRYFIKHMVTCKDIADSFLSVSFRRKQLVHQSGTGLFTTVLSLAIPLLTSLLTK